MSGGGHVGIYPKSHHVNFVVFFLKYVLFLRDRVYFGAWIMDVTEKWLNLSAFSMMSLMMEFDGVP